MANKAYKTEGGQGGKLGRSNMNHRELSVILKKDSNKLRRLNDKRAVKEGVSHDNQ
jgi:hypothetical protein